MTVDASEVLVDGPWRHRFVAANGARFHVAEAGRGPLVLLLHGFPQFWWCWRHQLEALAADGYRAVAMDLRGYGASDKPPRGYDTATLASDVAGVVRALGESRAVVVGHDWGAWLAWSLPAYAPRVIRAVAALSMAHPLQMRTRSLHRRQRTALGAVLAFQTPMIPERRLASGDAVEHILRSWGGPGYPDAECLNRYRRAMQVPFVAHTSLEYFRWALRSVPRPDGRRFVETLHTPVTVPVLRMHGGLDPYVLPETAATSRRWVAGPLREEVLPSAGHFLPEEAPAAVSAVLVDWLARLAPRVR
ncbi:MAG: alpha/beta hydrolase [Actinomycetales bacterium]|nr:alpha/beta hydrolase [Actinomycetales bacterium]